MRPERLHALEWLDRAKHDLHVAERLLVPGVIERGVIAFCAQQAAEKSFKAVLAEHAVGIPKVHDLTVVLAVCVEVEPDMTRFIEAATTLTPFAVRFRYPGPSLPTFEEAARAVSLAREAVDWVDRLVTA